MDSFSSFPKIARLSREAVITEKLDGTNAQILVWDPQSPEALCVFPTPLFPFIWSDGSVSIAAGSRTRWITPGKDTDNYGFAAWVQANGAELSKLGHGRHFGEWWGQGIQRNYGVPDKRFSLFNASRWSPSCPGAIIGDWNYSFDGIEDEAKVQIACCRVVPTIWRGTFDSFDINSALEMLNSHGSFAAPGFRDPEGIVIYHTAAKQLFKKTIKADESAKGTAHEIL